MKLKSLIIAFFVVVGLSSCAYKTCPTYAKQGAPVEKVQDSTEQEARL